MANVSVCQMDMQSDKFLLVKRVSMLTSKMLLTAEIGLSIAILESERCV
jgi:hypothetical protein